MRNGGARRLKSKVFFILGCPFQDLSHPAFQTASPIYFSYSSEHRVLLHIRHRDQNRLSKNETHVISVLRTGETGSCGKNILRNLSSTTVKSCGKGRAGSRSPAQGTAALTGRNPICSCSPPASPYTPSRSETTSCSQRSFFTVTQFICKAASSPAWPYGR